VVGIIVQENENIDRALKRFKKKYERSGTLKEYKKRTFYLKPSEERRMERLKSKRRAQKENAEKNK
jgi:small subunit ribosomal protein S21